MNRIADVFGIPPDPIMNQVENTISLEQPQVEPLRLPFEEEISEEIDGVGQRENTESDSQNEKEDAKAAENEVNLVELKSGSPFVCLPLKPCPLKNKSKYENKSNIFQAKMTYQKFG